jgi:serine/threonine-protein kinase
VFARCGRRERLRTLFSMFFRGQTVGKYRIVSALGSGGFGAVYLAEDTWIDKKVAIKVPHKQGIDFSELLKEPRILASMSHPNIVTVITAERQEDVFFIVMEYVEGETLEERILRDGALDLPVALDFTCQVCNAVDHAHAAGILHRDLRPGNILISGTGLLKVTDFGTSRFLESAAHGTTVIGSPPYMAPEQFHGKAVFASDVYAIGVTMFQMLTGELPYDTPAPADIDRLERGEFLSSPRLRNPKVPVALADIVLKALAPSLTERYARASEVLQDVLAARNDAPRRVARSTGGGGPIRDTVTSGEVQARLRSREEVPAARFCWHCSKPLHARADKCPFCGETQ